MSDQERLRAIAERERRATKGAWRFVRFNRPRRGESYPDEILKTTAVAATYPGHQIRTDHTGGVSPAFDAEFIAHAREDVPYLLSLVSRQAQEIQELRSRLASALAEREEALLSIGGVQSDLRKADQEIQDLRTERDHERHEKETVAEAGQAMVKHLWSSRDALREALKELRAVVMGECPSLLNEDSGGDARLALTIDKLLADSQTEG